MLLVNEDRASATDLLLIQHSQSRGYRTEVPVSCPKRNPLYQAGCEQMHVNPPHSPTHEFLRLNELQNLLISSDTN